MDKHILTRRYARMLSADSFRALMFIALVVFAFTSAASAQQPSRTVGSWLDAPPVNWNKGMASVPRAISTTQGDATLVRRCRETTRLPTNVAERALTRRGWMLYGAVQSFDQTRVVTALADFDGVCRPLRFQAFVYWEGRYAGTLAPAAMNSRTDGSLTNFRLSSPVRITAEFARYTGRDALCCAFAQSTVTYEVKRDDLPLVTPVNVETAPTCQPIESADRDNVDNALANNSPTTKRLSGRKWKLTAIRGVTIGTTGATNADDAPYIEFDGAQQRATGSGGCNRFSGGYKLDGGSLRFSPIVSTKRACVRDDLNRIESEFLQLLGEVTRFEIQGDTLRLYAGDKQVLSFAGE